MGRTNQTYRNRLETFIQQFKPFRKALRRKDKTYLDSLWEKAHYHSSASSYMNPRDPGATAIVSIQLEQEKEIQRLKKRIEDAEKEIECLR